MNEENKLTVASDILLEVFFRAPASLFYNSRGIFGGMTDTINTFFVVVVVF